MQSCNIYCLFFVFAAKADEDEEEGTISRPSSPKEGEAQDSEISLLKQSVSALPRESSSATVRIGEYKFVLY